MNNILKILTIVGAGLIIGGVAGKVIKTDKFRSFRSTNIPHKNDQRNSRKLIEEADKQADDLENYFI